MPDTTILPNLRKASKAALPLKKNSNGSNNGNADLESPDNIPKTKSMMSEITPMPSSSTSYRPHESSISSITSATTTEPIPSHLDPSTFPRSMHLPEGNIHLLLTFSPLDPSAILSDVSSPSAGANVLFLGTTRNTFEDRAVAQLSYTSYAPLALRTLSTIAEDAVSKYQLTGISIAHRLGVVPIQEASIAIAVSSGHRRAAWRAGEEVLERCKEKAEIWKQEEFVDGDAEWRANKDRDSDGKLVVKDVPTFSDGV
ncbi:molybdopterin synthase catalytic subunit [Paecilomyces variotii No. 5]|uniref:Molybdopterin synthase catalytic subunit n=1 Tax=Byssochlamys spectabilis (strain No. 5 / NBRC 109023) TaxID=1356009 RepID=V5HSH8_BYSSN|nr:molybdopterin synthase catalytic subunit [Paecilomyces variotii No. 5]